MSKIAPSSTTVELRWDWQQRLLSAKRWTELQLEELKRELQRRSSLDPLWEVCADAIGSLQFDLVDARVEKRHGR